MILSRSLRSCLLAGPVFLHLLSSGLATDAAPALITVDADSSPGPVNRLIFGHNMEAADNAHIFGSETTDPNTLRTGGGFWDPVKRAPVPAILERSREVGMGLMRYPGGCLAHNFDWRKAVGPLEKRSDWLFGVDEFLAYCRAVGAEPMFTVSDYVLPAAEMPENAAGLVEYLNAPADAAHPWALKRKEWGHPEPYGVKWFELGNESDHGNHRIVPFRKYDADDYAAYANATAAAMRLVDPTIKIGIVMVPGPTTDVECSWNRTVARLAGKSADFLIVHGYAPTGGPGLPEGAMLRACMAVGEQTEHHLDDYRAMALRESGRALPVAVTEYNGSLGEGSLEVPVKPYRFCYAEALECADLIRIFLRPEHQVLTASYWQFLNGYFGMLRSDRLAADGGKIEEEPAYPLYRLWGQHFGTKLLTTQVAGPTASFEGSGSALPASGDVYVEEKPLGPVSTEGRFQLSGGGASAAALEGGANGSFALRIVNATGKTYPGLARFPRPAKAGAGAYGYEVSYEARFVPDSGSDAVQLGLGLGDSRGWSKTRSAVAVYGITTEWKPFQVRYQPSVDAPAVDLVARLEAQALKISGRLEVRNFHINLFASARFPAYALLTATASTSADGKTLYLIVFNKSDQQEIPADIRLPGHPMGAARLWEVNGPGLGAIDGVTETLHGVPMIVSNDGTVRHVFPAHSMTAIEFSN